MEWGPKFLSSNYAIGTAIRYPVSYQDSGEFLFFPAHAREREKSRQQSISHLLADH